MNAREGTARPRVGLLGNPSDLYLGRVLGFTFDEFAARVGLEASPTCELVGPGGARAGFDSLETLEPGMLEGGCQLFAAALRCLARHAPERVDPAARPFRLTSTTDIPRQVGLSGSSALVVAALRALAEWFSVSLDPFTLSELALAAETEELGSTAGPQDRVLQAYEGLLYMDFSEPRKADQYARLDRDLLPPLFLAWDPVPGADSGSVHADVRRRWLAGDARVRAGIAVFPRLAAEGLARLLARDVAGLADVVDAAFEARASLFPIDPGDRERIALARAHGAGATLCGSGGALVGVPRSAGGPADLRIAFEAAGHRFLIPTPSRPRAVAG